jgi:hypothetical protein
MSCSRLLLDLARVGLLDSRLSWEGRNDLRYEILTQAHAAGGKLASQVGALRCLFILGVIAQECLCFL